MRIIGGKFKRKKLIIPIDKKTRPLKDLVKESIFNLIQHSNKFNVKIENSRILDLFSGSGSFGLECFSRGAKKVIFVENYTDALKILKKNLSSINAGKNCKIIDRDCFNLLSIGNPSLKNFKLIFIDPPYKEKKINLIIESIKKNKILDKEGILILHRHKSDNVQIKSYLKILETRTYGISKIIIGN